MAYTRGWFSVREWTGRAETKRRTMVQVPSSLPHRRPSAPCSPVESIGPLCPSVTGLQDEVSVTTGESISRRRRDDQGKEDLKKSADRVLIASAPLLASSTRPPASIHQPSLLASPALPPLPFVLRKNAPLAPLPSFVPYQQWPWTPSPSLPRAPPTRRRTSRRAPSRPSGSSSRPSPDRAPCRPSPPLDRPDPHRRSCARSGSSR